MTYYCCKHINANRDLVLNYVRTESELSKAVKDVRRQGFAPVKTIIHISDDGIRTETALK